jgi:hypothetical protein
MIKMKATSLVFGAVLILLPATEPQVAWAEDAPSPNWEEYERVSMVQLIATPKEFDGKKTQVCGFATIEFEGTALYLTRDDMKYLINRNSLWLDVRDWEEKRWTAHHRRAICVYGVFNAADKGHRGAHSGAVHEIARVLSLKPR